MAEFKPGEKIAKVVANNGFDTSSQGYASDLLFYGGSIKKDTSGKTVYDMQFSPFNPINAIDQLGDRRVRSTDEHIADASLFRKNLAKEWKGRTNKILGMMGLKEDSDLKKRAEQIWEGNKHKWIEKKKTQKVASQSLTNIGYEGYVKGHSLRHRHIGTPEEVRENIERLGLNDYYADHPWGIEFKRPEIYTDGINLLDVVLADKENKIPLQDIDINDALGKTARYIRHIHDNHGAIGELLLNDIQFQKKEGNKIEDPVLGLPDIVWGKNTTISETGKKATDMLDFMVNTAFFLRKTDQNPDTIKACLQTILQEYGDVQVIQAIRAYINPERKNKKLILPGEKGHGGILRKFSQAHNAARLGAEPQWASEVRQEVFQVTQQYINSSKHLFRN